MGLFLLPAVSPDIVAAHVRRDRFRRLMAAARANPADLAAMASPPTVTAIGDAITSGLTQSYTVVANPELFTVYGGVASLYSILWRVGAVTRTSGGNVVGTRDGIGARIAFRTDAPSLDVAMLAQASSAKVRFMIDGQYIDKTGSASLTTSGTNRFNITFPEGTARRLRRIDVEFEKDGAFRAVHVAPGDMMQPVSTAERYRIAVIGDSISAATGATRVHDGWAHVAAKRLGGVDVDMVSMSLGGTGYLNAGSGGTLKFGDRLDDLLVYGAGKVDEVWFAGGANDQGQPATAITAAVLACLQGARSRLPAAPVILFGAFVGGQGYSAALAVETALKAGFDQFADANSAFVPFNLATPAMQNANNHATYMAGAADTTHPADLGHDYIGAYAAEARRTIAL